MNLISAQKNIPKGWQEKKLGDICNIVNGSTPSTSNLAYWNGDINWYTPNDLKYQKFVLDGSDRKISKMGLKSIGSRVVPGRSLILSTRAPIGYLGITETEAVFNQGCKGLTSKDGKLSERFLYYILFSQKKALDGLGSGSTFLELSSNNLASFEILLPPIKEQQKIAEILGAVDEDIAKTQEVIETTEKLKRGLMRQLFTRGINDGISELELGKISKVTSSKRIMRSEYVEEGIPFYRSKEVIEKAKGLKHDSVFYISKERFDEIEKKFGAPHIGDILITAVGTIGVVYLVDEEGFYFKDGNLLWIKDIDKSLDRSYLKYYMNSEIFQKRVLGTAIGSNQKALTIEKVEKVIVPIPKLPEQKEIAEILSAVDEKISVNKKLKEKLTLLKKGLIQDLLSGRVRTINN